MIVKFSDIGGNVLKIFDDDFVPIPNLNEYIIIGTIYYKVIDILYDYDTNMICYSCERRLIDD